MKKFCGASYRGRRWRSKGAGLLMTNAPAPVTRSQRGRGSWRGFPGQ
ncbi:hypothetical protein C4J96_1301 [Pseudomonas orientalis]|nr:hypothetical protein C4J96_1301 [Pseudomonas orientalis]